MQIRFIWATALSPAVLVLTSCGGNPAGDSAQARTAPAHTATQAGYTITDVAKLDEPWALAADSGTGTLFVTERAGRIKFIEPGGTIGFVTGVPKVDYGGQGGLGDFVIAPSSRNSDRMLDTRTVYLSWVEAGEGDTRGAVVGKATMTCRDHASCALENLAVIWRQSPKVTGRGHFSHRIAISPDGRYLFVASGERQKFTPAQDVAVNLGKIVRLNLDGTAAKGNPFADRGGVPAQIWTLGHRNILGLAFDAHGRLWDLEHGPAGGDELNLVKPGQNYGWPVVSNGDHYDGKPIPRHATRPDFTAPAISWNPVIGPGNFIFVAGPQFPQWRGNVLAAGLVSEGLVRVAIDGETAREVERISMGKRIRAITQDKDGAIWIIEDGKGARLRKLTGRR